MRKDCKDISKNIVAGRTDPHNLVLYNHLGTYCLSWIFEVFGTYSVLKLASVADTDCHRISSLNNSNYMYNLSPYNL